MSIHFLQITPSTELQQTAVTQVSKQMQLWDIMQSGGALMIPLGLLLILAVFFFFERYIAIKKAANVKQMDLDTFLQVFNVKTKPDGKYQVQKHFKASR